MHMIRLFKKYIYKLDAESRELRDLESRGPDVASRGFLNRVVPDDECV